MLSPELPGPENALAPLLNPVPGVLGADEVLGWTTMAPLVELLAPAPGIEGAPDGAANQPPLLAPRPPPALALLFDETLPLALKPVFPGVPMEYGEAEYGEAELLEGAPPPEVPGEPVAPRAPLLFRWVVPKLELPALPEDPELPLAEAPPVALRPPSVAVPVALPAEPAGAIDDGTVCAATEKLNTAAPNPTSRSAERGRCIMTSCA